MENKNTTAEVEIDLLEIFYLLRSKLLVIILTTVLFAAAAGCFSKFFMTPIYSSTSKLYILTQSTSLTSLADIQMGTQLTQDYMELIKSRPVVEAVIHNLKLDTTYEDMLSKISISNPSNTRILNLTVEDADPRMAKEIVDELANVSIVRISSIMATDEPNIVEEGHIAAYPIKPGIKKNTVIGALLGIFISCGLIIMIYLLDDTIHSAEDVEKYLGLNTLVMVPIGRDEYDGAKRKKGLFGRKKNKKKSSKRHKNATKRK